MQCLQHVLLGPHCLREQLGKGRDGAVTAMCRGGRRDAACLGRLAGLWALMWRHSTGLGGRSGGTVLPQGIQSGFKPQTHLIMGKLQAQEEQELLTAVFLFPFLLSPCLICREPGSLRSMRDCGFDGEGRFLAQSFAPAYGVYHLMPEELRCFARYRTAAPSATAG